MNLTAALATIITGFFAAMSAVAVAFVARPKNDQTDSQVRVLVDRIVDEVTDDLRAENERLRSQNAELRGRNRALAADNRQLKREDGDAHD